MFAGKAGVFPSPVRAILRLLLWKKHGKISEEDWRAFMALETNTNHFIKAGGERLENFMLMARACHHYSETELPVELAADMFATVLYLAPLPYTRKLR